MNPFQIRLPYTRGEGILHLTTDNRCYAQLAKGILENTPDAASVFENAKKACHHAMEVFEHVKDCINKLPPETDEKATRQLDQLAKSADTSVKALEEQVKALNEDGKLFSVVVAAASESRDAAAKAFREIENLRSNSSNPHVQKAVMVCQNEQETIKESMATIAAEQQLEGEYDRNNKKLVLVIGGGVSGLMTAWILLDKGYRVTIVAKEWCQLDDNKADRMTSQVAGALWEYPPGGCGLSEIEVPVLAYSTLAQYRTWALQSFLFYQHLAGLKKLTGEPDSLFGARMVTLYQFFQKPPPSEPPSEPQINSAVATDVVARRAEESAWDHYNKWKEIEQLDTTHADFYEKLNASCHKFSDAEPDNEWKKAKEAIQHGPNGIDLNWGYRHKAPVVDTDVAMEFLMKIVQDKGATLETRHIQEDLHLQERELMDDFKADLIVNASGLGAKVLASDNQVFPVRGAVRRMTLERNDAAGLEKMRDVILPQRTDQEWTALLTNHDTTANGFLKDNAVLLPAQYDSHNRPGKTVFIVPRKKDTIIVGSIIQRNNWDLGLTLQSPEVDDMWKRAYSMMPALATRKPDARPLAQGLRPFSHSNVRVSADNRTASCRVVHNYGHGGSGWTLAVGSAWTCVQIVERMLHRAESGSVANAQVWGLCGR